MNTVYKLYIEHPVFIENVTTVCLRRGLPDHWLLLKVMLPNWLLVYSTCCIVVTSTSARTRVRARCWSKAREEAPSIQRGSVGREDVNAGGKRVSGECEPVF